MFSKMPIVGSGGSSEINPIIAEDMYETHWFCTTNIPVTDEGTYLFYFTLIAGGGISNIGNVTITGYKEMEILKPLSMADNLVCATLVSKVKMASNSILTVVDTSASGSGTGRILYNLVKLSN